MGGCGKGKGGLPVTARLWLLALLCVTALACGDDDDGGRRATPTNTVATATATVPPTATGTALATATPSSAPTHTATAAPTDTATATASPTVATPRAVARRIADSTDLIGGPLAIGRIGDYLIANDRLRAIVRAPGREMSFALLYGGNIIDADRVRPAGEPGRDNFGAMTPLINLSLTAHVTEVTVVNDGADGNPAVLRASGVDDLLDAFDLVNAIKAFGFGMVPESTRDRDLPVEIVTDYTLGVGDDAIRIETTIHNRGATDLNTYAGDLLSPSGQDDTFVPAVGFGDALLYAELPWIAWPGRGASEGVAYGIIPAPMPGAPLAASGFGQSGILGLLYGQSFVDTLLFQTPGIIDIPAGESRSFVRYFAVGDGDAGGINDVRHALFDVATGTVHGLVTAGGRPAAGAFVSVAERVGDEVPLAIRAGFRTDTDGRYAGTLPPGNYVVMAKLEGHPYDSGTSAPAEHAIIITPGEETEQNIALPETARLRVTVRDTRGAALPAKVTVVGFHPAPEPAIGGGTFLFGSNVDQQGEELFGIAAVAFVDQSGDSGDVLLPPAAYEVVVSRGHEYAIHRERVTLTSGATTAVEAVLVRVLDTSGFVASDYHVHMIHSFDCPVTRDDRIRTMAAEGVEYFVASDHDFVTDLRPDIERLGLGDHVAAGVSSEVTTFNLGHFNVWPFERDPDSHTGGAIDWGRAGVPAGEDFPALGSFDLSPAELFATMRSRITPGTGGGVIQINHINDGSLGFFTLAGIDSAAVPPRSFTPPELMRQNPVIANLYDDGYDTLELWVVGSRSQTSVLRGANFGDWFNLLNQGIVKAATANSDTHSTAVVQAGGPRNFVAASADVPRDLDHAELAASVRQGRLIASNAPFVRIELEGDGGALAGHALGAPTLVPATAGEATLRIHVESPAWAEFDTIEVFANAATVAMPDRNLHGVEVPRYDAEPTRLLHAGTDFTVRRVVVEPDIAGAERLEADVELALPVDTDTWVVVLVRGTDGISRPIWPMNPQDLEPGSNATLDDLTDGNLGEGGNTALAFTNPLFLDADGDGRFDPRP